MGKGMELAKGYYLEYGEPMLEKKFPEYVSRIACGFAGEGSDAFGFDDQLSRDHDFGPGFCLWLADEDMERIGPALQEAYLALPQTFQGFERKRDEGMALGRTGVMRISDFYAKYTGMAEGPIEQDQWMRIPEQFLATATNGSVFTDPLGEFTRIREKLLEFYPEDVRIKKLSCNCHKMGQAGQYNYPRLLQRGDFVAAMLALSEFTEAAMKAVYLLNRRYTPYYKWTFRGMGNLSKLTNIAPLLSRICKDPCREENVQLIETICIAIREELMEQKLTETTSDFLCDQSFALLKHIEDPHIAGLPLTVG